MSLSAGLNDPSILLKDAPVLPKTIPAGASLSGRPIWHVLDLGDTRSSDKATTDIDFDLNYLYGACKEFCLLYPTLIHFKVSLSIPLSYHSGL